MHIGSRIVVRTLPADTGGPEFGVAPLPDQADVPESGGLSTGPVRLGAFVDGTLCGTLTAHVTLSSAADPAGADHVRISGLTLTAEGKGDAEEVTQTLLREAAERGLRSGATAVALDDVDAAPVTLPAVLQQPLQERADVRVREIVDAEIPAVSELVLEAYREDYALLPEEYLAEIADVAGRARAHLVWVAEDRATGELLGTITTPRPGQRMSEVARTGEMDLRLLGVARAARGRGIGSLLMRHGLRLARMRGTPRVVLNTSTEMVAAYELYDRMGFSRLSEREEHIVREDGSEFTLLAYGIDVPQ